MSSGENSNATLAASGNPERFRIFLASPGDVPLERKLAREAIIHIGSERRFRGRITIEIVAWDQPGAAVAMEACLTPQEAISRGLPKPEECDLAVVVMWSRIGTQLPADFELKKDESPYLSGTEWEYFNALNGKPAVWVYRRQDAPQITADDPARREKLDQWDKVESFFAGFINPDGSLKGGINLYKSPDDFRRQFEQHLRDHLEKLLESLPEIKTDEAESKPTPAPRWNSSPYPGLKAFTPEQAPIFFGRGSEVDQLLEQFRDSNVQFVAVVGVSGSGKSSLVKAGFLPLLRSGVIGGMPWADLCLKPGERGGNPFLALAYALNAQLELTGQTEQELADAMQADTAVALERLNRLLAQQEDTAELLLLIDQFEELFTQCNEVDREDFLKLLEKIVAQKQMRVITTMRADFYGQAIEEPLLASLLRRDRGTFPLDPPGVGAILEMIVRPAEAAGLELNKTLPQRLIDDAGTGPGAMAVIAFTLNRLYEKYKLSQGCLDIKAYQDIGGVKGAIDNRAETALKNPGMKAALPELFEGLVKVNEHEVATRHRAPLSQLKGDVRSVADRLTDARLLVTGKGKDDQPTLEVAHETILTGWQRLDKWIRSHAEVLRTRRDLEHVAAEWSNSGCSRSALRGGKLLTHYLSAAESDKKGVAEYLSACKRRRLLHRLSYGLLAFLVIIAIGIFIHAAKSQYGLMLATKGLFMHLGLRPVDIPIMKLIPAGQFQMGDLASDGEQDERHIRTVSISKFEMGTYEVTFEEYDIFAAATGRRKPSDEGWKYNVDNKRGKLPVINISWEDANAYAKWLSKHIGLEEPHHYRLPSEAEWEYAARAGTSTVRYWLENAEDEPNAACLYANVFDAQNAVFLRERHSAMNWEEFDCMDEFAHASPVGEFKSNAWHLHDMLGNVWEWTQDCYIENYEVVPNNGLPYERDNDEVCNWRVLRGGSWDSGPEYLRSANRYRNTPDDLNNTVGFRLARTP